jgi:hypothetical protein
MKKILFCGLAASLIIISCKNLGSTLVKLNHSIKLKHVDRIVYFDPEVYPNFEEIKEPTHNVIYSAVSAPLFRQDSLIIFTSTLSYLMLALLMYMIL